MAVSDWLPLAGVIIGAGCTGGVQAWHEAKRDRRQLRAAERLVAEGLVTNRGTVAIIARDGKWPARQDEHLVVQDAAWEMHKGALAATPDFRPWAPLSIAYIQLRNTALAMDRFPGQPLGEAPISDTLESVDEAARVLGGYV